ncbi:copper resistance CopC family protein [Amycolatopsis nigrescens]|uniref:copper resistance CopC family protein n=1 Tax=Amycolatopsis nigrescens TaxID=381445 RepID=UPI0003779CC5|nr:copper resistance CopC family protein [Amycolatopsis nigrescens]
MSLRRICTPLLVAAAALVATASPAFAHTKLTSSDPAEGATLAGAPAEIRLTFGAAVTLPEGAIKVSGPENAQWKIGAPEVAGTVVTAPVQPAGPAGQYTVDYRVLAEDGDAVTGKIRFTLSTGASPTSTVTFSPALGPAPEHISPAPRAAAPEPVDDSGVPWPVWTALGILVAAIAAFLLVRGRRSSP